MEDMCQVSAVRLQSPTDFPEVEPVAVCIELTQTSVQFHPLS